VVLEVGASRCAETAYVYGIPIQTTWAANTIVACTVVADLDANFMYDLAGRIELKMVRGPFRMTAVVERNAVVVGPQHVNFEDTRSWADQFWTVTRFSGFIRSTFHQSTRKTAFKRLQFRLVERPLKELWRSSPSEMVSRC
jgi:hypothetical protein